MKNLTRRRNVKSHSNAKYLVTAVVCIVLMGAGYWFLIQKGEEPLPPQPTSGTGIKKMAIPPEKIIDYNKLDKKTDQALTSLMEERKAPYGVEKSIDMIVKPDESIRVGQRTVQMKSILAKVRLSLGEIVETDLSGELEGRRKEESFGIHVVKPNENIWDIHFDLLRDYYNHKGIHLSPLADEPNNRGFSTGVGKILKFSESLVHIYNIKERRLETNINLIYPLSKIVVYNMGRVFALLDAVDYKDVNRIEFDGQTLWLPSIQ